jgi:phosphoglycerol transferase MdoB-like AlkP superfamily enzyme
MPGGHDERHILLTAGELVDEPRPIRLTAHALALLGVNVVGFAAYRLLFVLWFGHHPTGPDLLVVLLRGLRLDAAVLGLELIVVAAILLLTRYARGGVLIAALWVALAVNLLTAAINLLFVRRRNQHLWETLFANLAEPHDFWATLRPFLLGHPGLVALLIAAVVGLAMAATRHAAGLRAHRHDLWRPWYVPVAVLAILLLLAPLMAHWVTVKRVSGRANREIAWIASRHQMVFDDFVLNQAVVNPVWDLLHEYVPVAFRGSRPPYRLEAAEATALAQRLLGLPEGSARYPLLRTVRGLGGLDIRNVIVIQVEGLGATLLERDEPQGPVMPFVRGLAAEGLYFPRVYQSFPSTDGAVFATVTSLHWTHVFSGGGVRLSESVMGAYFGSLPRLLATPEMRHYAYSGFRQRTAEFVTLTRNLGYRTSGFDAMVQRLGPRAAQDAGPLGIHDGSLLREVAKTLSVTRDPFDVYVMTGTSHSPWEVPAGSPLPLGNGPLGTFRYVDDSIRAFVERLRADRRDFDHTLLVITGDHTSATFGPHRLERLRVPLVLAGPPIARARGRWPARSEDPASQVDILPTILSLLDGERSYAGMGRSLFEGASPATAGIVSGDTHESFYFKDGFALRYDLRSGHAQLLAVDGDEMPPADLAAEHPEVATRLTREFLALYETADRLIRENRVFPLRP